MKLNMGSGQNPREGYINVDKYHPADAIIDLEEFGEILKETNVMGEHSFHRTHGYKPWPWEDSSVDEILFYHSLEHMGETVEKYKHVIGECYRVLKPDGSLVVTAPHPRHDNFINDPTHVRALTPEQFLLFSQKHNDECASNKSASSPLGKHWGVNFEIVSTQLIVEQSTQDRINPTLTTDQVRKSLQEFSRRENNVIVDFTSTLRAIK